MLVCACPCCARHVDTLQLLVGDVSKIAQVVACWKTFSSTTVLVRSGALAVCDDLTCQLLVCMVQN